MIKGKLLVIWLTVLMFLISNPALANHKSANTGSAHLKQLSSKIASIKNLLTKNHNKRNQLQTALKKNEVTSGKISKQLHRTNHTLNKNIVLLQTLKKSKTRYQNKMESQRTLLTKEVKTAYMLGRQPYLKLILNQQDSNKLSRALVYYRYINQYRITAINDLQETLSQLEINKQKIQKQYNTLQILQKKQKHEKTNLATIQKTRTTLIKKINNNIQTQTQRLQHLIANKNRLEKTLKELARKQQGLAFGNFAQDRRKLSWPTKGKLLPIFGTKIEKSELRWGGVLIEAPSGQAIHTIANGKVVFAKWLSGYGLLIIISHGHGYMTLYGRNGALYKKTGDIVHKGDVIATVGQSGGYQSSALYFAIRHNGKSLNPASWCRQA